MGAEPSSLEKAMEAEAGHGIGWSFAPDPAQLDLLRDKHGALPADALRTVRANRGRGRPPNAQNRHSKDIARYFITKYGDPLDALGEIINTPDDVLYEQMVLAQGGERKAKRVTGADAKRLKMQAIDMVLPYIHGKAPIRIDHQHRAAVILNIPGLTDAAHLAELTGEYGVTEDELARLEYNPHGFTASGEVQEADWADAEAVGDETDDEA